MSSRKRPREGPELSTECKKGMIIALRQEGHTFRYIGQKLELQKALYIACDVGIVRKEQ